MSITAAANMLAVANLALEAATRVAAYNAIVQRAVAEGRDVTDEEVAQARAIAAAAVDALAGQSLGAQVANAIRP